MYLISMYYKRYELQWRFSLFFSASIIAGAFGGVSSKVDVDDQNDFADLHSFLHTLLRRWMVSEGIRAGDGLRNLKRWL